jgi:uncharacterized protein YijF (DUF1287 family)
MKTLFSILLFGFLLAGGEGCAEPARTPANTATAGRAASPAKPAAPAAAVAESAAAQKTAKVVAAAKAQVGVTTGYDPAYVRIPFPNGDVPAATGVCADVVVRALRVAGRDLQALVNADMKANFTQYPQKWGLRKPDPNIDHRRVANLMKWFERQGKTAADGFLPGDIVAWDLNGNGLLHIGVVSDVNSADGKRRLVVHNIGRGAQQEDVLLSWKIIGHYRPFP